MTRSQPTTAVHGLHHVTAIAGDAQENLDFYTRVMGMRLVKRSVNQDAPDTYHLFYADEAGTPGTDLTFFPWPDMRPARRGVGQIVEVPFAVPVGSLTYWQNRFAEHNVSYEPVEERFGEKTLPFVDPHGLHLALVESSDEREFEPWEKSPVPAEHQVRGMHSIRMWVAQLSPTETLLTQTFGLDKIGADDDWHRYGVDGGHSGTLAEVKVMGGEGQGWWGTGGVHHAAWRVRDRSEQEQLLEAVSETGLNPTAPIDRFWFQSVYFKEPGGVLFELATDGPGFSRDEDPEHLGEKLILPPWMEKDRRAIESALPSLELPD